MNPTDETHSLPQCPVLLVCLVPMVAVYWYIQHFYR